MLEGNAALAGATVVVDVGGTTVFETITDELGAFRIGIETEDADAVTIVRVTGSARLGQRAAAFATVIGPVGDLVAAAGADGVLDAAEDEDLFVNELSTG